MSDGHTFLGSNGVEVTGGETACKCTMESSTTFLVTYFLLPERNEFSSVLGLIERGQRSADLSLWSIWDVA